MVLLTALLSRDARAAEVHDENGNAAGTPSQALPCGPGLTEAVNASNACCWPDQRWNGVTCIGVPICPEGEVASGYRCVGGGGGAGAPATEQVRPLEWVDVEVAEMGGAELRAKAHAARVESIQELNSFTRNLNGPPSQKAELILRLAHLYFDEGRSLYLEAVAPRRLPNGGGLGIDGQPVASEWLGAGQGLRRAASLYEQILRNVPEFSGSDEGIYFLGEALTLVNTPDLGANEHAMLILRYPNSKYVPASAMQLGEYYLQEKHDPGAAAAWYVRAFDTEPQLAAFAHYKLAWCYFLRGDGDVALEFMRHVRASLQGATSRGDILLSSRAERDLAVFGADVQVP